MEDLIHSIKNCTICQEKLPLVTKPIFSAHPEAKLLIIGQAPGIKAHKSGIPWNDASGVQLRKWLGITTEEFYDDSKIAILPMGFCYPGKSKSGDLPPMRECAPTWHNLLSENMPAIKLKLLIGQYAQKYYLKKSAKKNVTETVKSYSEYLPEFLPLPHPSPRNRFWLQKNPWFAEEIIPELQTIVAGILKT